MNTSSSLTRSVQSMTVGDSNDSVLGLFHKGDAELVKKYGEPSALKMHADGNVERTWNIDSGTLHVVHAPDGKVSDVKFFNNISAAELQTMSQKSQA